MKPRHEAGASLLAMAASQQEMEQVLSYEDALATVLAHAAALAPAGEVQLTALLDAAGRVLANPLVADRDQPPFFRSTRDGFALCSADLQVSPVDLQILGMIKAGDRWDGAALERGQAIEIMTGAPMPAGADAVLMVEHAAVEAGVLRPATGRRLAAGENVVPAGAEARCGDVLIPAGRVLGAAEIGLAASCGAIKLQVYARPRVAILATGDELVALEARPTAWQIRNSNSYALAALVESEGAEAWRLPVARDTAEDLRARLQESLESAEFLLLSGGVSMGKYDLVEAALREFGATFYFTGARIQPGKPVVFGRLPRPQGGSTYFFGLPGNPVSTEVCFRLFAAPLLRALCGRTEGAPRFGEARLMEEVRGGPKVTRFLPALVTSDWQRVEVRPVAWQGSGDLAANARANGFVVLPERADRFRAGEAVRVLLR